MSQAGTRSGPAQFSDVQRHATVQAGHAAGCQGSLLVRTGTGEETASQLKKGQATFIGNSLIEHDAIALAGNWGKSRKIRWIMMQPERNSIERIVHINEYPLSMGCRVFQCLSPVII